MKILFSDMFFWEEDFLSIIYNGWRGESFLKPSDNLNKIYIVLENLTPFRYH